MEVMDFYTIKQKGSDVALDVANASVGSGANIQAHITNGTIAQKWAITKNDKDGYRIQGKCSGLSIVVEDNRAVGGTNIHQYINMDISGESWLFIPYKPSQPISNGRYMILSAVDNTKELDVPGNTGDIENATNLQIWSNDALSQYNSFDVTKLSNGYYKLVHHASGKAMEITRGGSDPTSPVTLYTDNGSITQQWAIMNDGTGGYTLKVRSSGYAMDLTNANTDNGSPIRQYYYNGSAAESWSFVRAEYTISYNANGGSGAPSNQTKYYNNNLTLSSTKPTLTGYTFQSWNTKADGTGTNYAAGGSYTTNADVTLYAMWKKQDEEPPIITGGNLEILSDTLCRFTVTATDNIGIDHVDIHTWYGDYSGSGDTVYKATKSGNHWYYDVPCNLTNNTVRWMDARVFDASGNQALVSGLTILVGKLKYVDITFDANEGFCSVASKKVIWAEYINRLKGNTFVSNYGQLPIPERRGYSFTGWYTEQTGGTKVEESTPVTRNESYTLYAHWTELKPDFILPSALTSIEEEAFEGGVFTYVKLSVNTIIIRSKAFANCNNLGHIYIPEATITIAADAFSGVDKSMVIHGTDGSYAEFYANKYGFQFVAE